MSFICKIFRLYARCIGFTQMTAVYSTFVKKVFVLNY